MRWNDLLPKDQRIYANGLAGRSLFLPPVRVESMRKDGM
ncbi:predicted protein [Plenodomus lingam JN3]|uniref:Predicted protein n=1 Tax=Leptosphaeria maculans (strain JN3 / isolate v23.1.3 / race Av1-4-5-6-7-8) TaxID=985895 RepID=E5A8T2_LEPMJ|nr:predicted protein [Plenodomus lingam JN3]CBY00027.1 predicted protein [Plenodomus lingam JN3]